MIEEEMQKYVESLERASELLIQKKKEELQKEIEKRDKEKWISEHSEYRETHEMIELAKKAEAGEATEEQREILRQWAEKSITSSLVYEDSDDDAGRDGNTSDEDLSGKERKAKEGKASESPSSSSSTILPKKVISLASIREVYSKFKAKGGEDGDSDDEELRGLEEEYFKYLDILRRQLNGGESGKDKIEKSLKSFIKIVLVTT